MKGFVTHAVSLLVGFFLAAFVFLYLAKLTSIVWQNNLKGSITYLLQVDGAKAAQAKDWAHVQYAFQTSEKIESNVRPREWDVSLPIYGWSTVGLIKYSDHAFWLSDMSVLAYSLEQQGKVEEANNVYKMLSQAYPSKDRTYFDAIAQQSLSALANGAPAK